MNYYGARKLSDGGGWHYTCRNDDRIWPVGYCRGHDPHATEAEAYACFDRYLLDEIREEEYGDWTGCEAKGCDRPTKKGLTTRPPLGRGYALCDEHRTEEVVRDLAGWHGEHVTITASY